MKWSIISLSVTNKVGLVTNKISKTVVSCMHERMYCIRIFVRTWSHARDYSVMSNKYLKSFDRITTFIFFQILLFTIWQSSQQTSACCCGAIRAIMFLGTIRKLFIKFFSDFRFERKLRMGMLCIKFSENQNYWYIVYIWWFFFQYFCRPSI